MRLGSLLASLALSVVAFAQTVFQEKVTVSYVEIPVTVVGRDGGAVRGLSKANFEVYEDGHKRSIESFDAVDFASSESMKAISPLNPASRRNFLLLFDLSFSNPTSVGRAQEAAREFIARSVGSRDLVSIGVADVDRGFRFLTAFTTDRNLLLAAIADPATFRTVDPLQISGTNPIQITQDAGGAQGGEVSERRSIAQENFADAARELGRMDDSYMRSRVRRQVESLGAIAHTLQKLAGRKHLVLLSEGFDPRLVQGRLGTDVKEQTEENAFIASGEVWKVDSDRRFGNASSQMSIKMMADEFRRADVVLHAVDIKGVRVQNDMTGAKVTSNEGLFLLANPTGGTVFRNSNSISDDFDRLTRQHEVVYVLGFRAPAGKPGRLHDLKVKLVNVPGARAQHRDGYYDAGDEGGIERSLSMAEVIINDIPQGDLDIAALAAAFPGEDDKSQVPVVLEIRGDDLVTSAKNDLATTEIFIYAFDEDGIVRDSLIQRVALDMGKVATRLRGRGIRFYGTLHLPPGRYAVKSLVRVGETDKRGYKRLDLEVPAAGDVAVVRPLFFAGPQAEEWVMVKSWRDTAKTVYPFVLDGESFIPAARATVRPDESRRFAVFVYNAGPDEITFEITPEAKLVSTTEGTTVTKYVFALGRVPANTTALDVTIRKKGSADSRKVSVPITVQ